MSPAADPDARRAAMNVLYTRLREATAGPVFAVPAWVVQAFVAAWFARAGLAEACARAHFGQQLDDLGPRGQACARQWAATLRNLVGD